MPGPIGCSRRVDGVLGAVCLIPVQRLDVTPAGNAGRGGGPLGLFGWVRHAPVSSCGSHERFCRCTDL